MKKWIVLTMALIFALGVTSMAFAAEEKKPGVPGLGPEEKGQIADTKKKATVKKKAKKPGPPPGLGPEEKQQMEDAKKPSTADKMKKKEAAPAAAPAAPAAAPAPDKK